MKSLGRLVSVVSLTAAVFAMPAAISVAEASSVLVDDGSYTYDPHTHLDWLDLTATQGLSYDQVTANDGVSYIADGWHYATFSDVLSLYKDAGIVFTEFPDANNPGDYGYDLLSPTPDSTVQALINLLGQTFEPDYDLPGTGSYGVFQSTTAGYYGVAIAQIYPDRPNPPRPDFASEAVVLDNHFTTADLTDFDGIGSYLVRDADVAATPLPASSLLFASGIGLIGFVAWRRKRAEVSAAICA